MKSLVSVLCHSKKLHDPRQACLQAMPRAEMKDSMQLLCVEDEAHCAAQHSAQASIKGVVLSTIRVDTL